MWMKYNFAPAGLRGRVILGKGEKMSDHYDRYNGMEELLSTNLAEVGTDAISRQKAISALYEWECDNKDDRDAIDVINGLPPIQPDIVRCKDCEYHHKRICPIERYFSLDGFCSRGER